MNILIAFFILTSSSLFILVNFIDLSPVILSMVDHCDGQERCRIAFKGIFQQIMGLILMVMSVQFVIEGIGSVFKSWFSF